MCSFVPITFFMQNIARIDCPICEEGIFFLKPERVCYQGSYWNARLSGLWTDSVFETVAGALAEAVVRVIGRQGNALLVLPYAM